jgi:hypothetical protein
MAIRMVLLAYRVAVVWMRMPLQAPAAVNMTVVVPQEEVQRACEGRDEGDVGERPAHEVVAALCRPVDQVMKADRDWHSARLSRRAAVSRQSGATGEPHAGAAITFAGRHLHTDATGQATLALRPGTYSATATAAGYAPAAIHCNV